MHKTYKISISGQVQGVGFRPYVYALATRFLVKGFVSNNEEGVLIYAQGPTQNLQAFYDKLIQTPPPVSLIKNSTITEIESREFLDFKIEASSKTGQINLALTPDFAICSRCQQELKDPNNHRHAYPFTTCVHCGPRWAITQGFPFERDHTRMSEFHMCEQCGGEYSAPENRRFHSQTNSCSTCGISVKLVNDEGVDIPLSKSQIFSKIAALLGDGKIIAIKNTSGFLLCCNAENKNAVQLLRTRKNRPKKPLAVLYPSLEQLKKELHLKNEEEKALLSTERPICIVNLKDYSGKIALEDVAPQLQQLGVMLPYTGILQLLANELEFPIVATSGNIHGSPIISDNNEALNSLKNVADYFLLHNLTIEHPQDDSVIKFSYVSGLPVLFRRSRGFAPNFFNTVVKSDEKILAMGAHLKSSIAFYPNDYLYISQYLGNLDNFEVYNRFTAAANSFLNIFEQEPSVILVDAHPLYQSTQYGKELAKQKGLKTIEIQHHKAHFAAILGNHDLFHKKVLGVVFDGTGYGEDGAIWGGEFFEYKNGEMRRIQHLDYFEWMLADKMAKEPRLSLFAMADESFDPILNRKFEAHELKTYRSLKKTNTLKSSSVGRLFDAVASLLDICDYNSYEGEGAILLENLLGTDHMDSSRNYCKSPENGINALEILKGILSDIKNGVSKTQCAHNFIFTLATVIVAIAEKGNYSQIACSGGVFQNTSLVDMLIALVPKEILLYFHQNLSPNDENISFGQIMYYLNIRK